MLKTIKKIKTSIILLILLSILTGVIYPAVMTGISQLLFPWKANGSLIEKNGYVVGSVLIGQSFVNPRYFWGRPSATSPYPYNATASSGSNYGPINPDFLNNVKTMIDVFKKADPENIDSVPVDLVTSSASGMDPDISPLAADYQAARIAKARGFPETVVRQLIDEYITNRFLGVFGEPTVNVLQLNLALDALDKRPAYAKE